MYNKVLACDEVCIVLVYVFNSQKKRYKSCHWGCTFSKGTLLHPKLAIGTLVVHIST